MSSGHLGEFLRCLTISARQLELLLFPDFVLATITLFNE
jgi:hypothetical protein